MLPEKKSRIYLIIAGFGLYFFANFQRTAIPGAIFNELQSTLDISAFAVTAFGAVFMYIYSINQLLVGLAVDRFSGFRVIFHGSILFCCGSLIFGMSKSLWLLYLARAMSGFGASVIYLSMVNELRNTCSKRNFPMGIAVLLWTGCMGAVTANTPFIELVKRSSWQWAVMLVAIATTLIFGIFAILYRKVPVPAVNREVKLLAFTPFISVLKKQNNRRVYAFSAINFGCFYVLQTAIGKKFLEDFCRMSSDTAGWMMSLIVFVSAFSGLFFSVSCRMLNNNRSKLMRFSSCVAMAVYGTGIAALLLDIRTPALGLLICLAALTSTSGTLTVPMLQDTNPKELAGTSVSVGNFCSYLAVSCFGLCSGFLMDIFNNAPATGDKVKIYGSNSYLAVFAVLFILATVAFHNACRVRENG